MKTFLQKLRRDEVGANLVEYGILIVLVALVAATGLSALGTNLSNFFDSIANTISGANVPTLP
jgi:pilus assembly protein Flp/PilA